jgi:hypothetical protein
MYRATSIEQGALFDFDMEVDPVLHVLVTKAYDTTLFFYRRPSISASSISIYFYIRCVETV